MTGCIIQIKVFDWRRLIIKRIITSIFNTIFSFELVFILFLLSGRFKADPRLDWSPIDLTLLFFIISIFAGFVVLLRSNFKFNKKPFILSMLYFLFALYAAISLFWSPSYIYASEKLIYLLTLVLWSTAGAAFIISQDKKRVERVLIFLFAISLWFVLEGTYAYTVTQNRSFLNLFGGNYLGVGRVIGIGAIIVMGYLSYMAKSILWKSIVIILFTYYIWILLTTGGRGPLIATLIPCLFLLIVNWPYMKKHFKPHRFRVQITVFIVLIIVTIIIMQVGLETKTMSRMTLLMEDDIGVSASSRIQSYKHSYYMWVENPLLGNGIGSYPIYISDKDIRLYPHNILLEILSELGLIGFMLFFTFLLYAHYVFLYSGQIGSDPLKVIILLSFINALINAFLSGDLADNRFLFFTIGLLVYHPHNRLKKVVDCR